MDIRGHGLSDKPHEGYADSRLWADDVNATIQALRLDHPILAVGHTEPSSSSTISGITARIASAVSTLSVPSRSLAVTRRYRFSPQRFSTCSTAVPRATLKQSQS